MTYFISFTARNRKTVIECSSLEEANKVMSHMHGECINVQVLTKRPIKADIRVMGDWWLSKV